MQRSDNFARESTDCSNSRRDEEEQMTSLVLQSAGSLTLASHEERASAARQNDFVESSTDLVVVVVDPDNNLETNNNNNRQEPFVNSTSAAVQQQHQLTVYDSDATALAVKQQPCGELMALSEKSTDLVQHSGQQQSSVAAITEQTQSASNNNNNCYELEMYDPQAQTQLDTWLHTSKEGQAGELEYMVDLQAGRASIVQIPDVAVAGATKHQLQSFAMKEQEELDTDNNNYDEDEEFDFHNIPRGRWRDGFCNCCAHGFCHPALCLAYWATPVALGQVMTRMNLEVGSGKPTTTTTLNGRPILQQQQHWTPFKILLVLFLLDYVVQKAIGLNLLYVFFYCYVLWLMIRTRSYIRTRYNIPEGCGGCEDFCASFWFPCCTVAQMARHTANYHQYSAVCCTDTGLSEQASHVV